MTALIPFDYSGRQVRTVQVDGEPWFVAADVCAVLELNNVTMAVASLDEDEKGFSNVETPGGEQRVVIVNEPGLYSLILRSRKPEAKAFKRWLTHEVIPSLRKNGRYEVAEVSRRELAQMVIAEADRADAAEAQVKALQPKADYVDGFVGATTDATLLRVLANQLGVKETDLRDLLVQRKVIYRKLEGSRWSNRKGRQMPEYSWHAYSDYTTWFVERDQPEAPRLHNGQMRTTLYVTPVGKVKVADLIAKAGAA